MMSFLLVNFPSVIVLDKLGLKYGLIIGISLTTLGLWLRCLINIHFTFAMVGQTIMALAFPFTFNAPALLSANWFGEKERIYATSTGANASILGVGLGYLIPIIFVSDNDRGSTAEAHIFNLMLCLSIMSTLILIPLIFTFQAKPINPPAKSQEKT